MVKVPAFWPAQVPCMLKEFADWVIFPCQVAERVVVLSVKLIVPAKLPFGSTCAFMVVAIVAPLERVIEPVKTPFASIATDIVPLAE